MSEFVEIRYFSRVPRLAAIPTKRRERRRVRCAECFRWRGHAADDEDFLDLLDQAGRLVAALRIPSQTMFWSDGTFERGEAFADHADFSARLEEVSRQRHPARSGESVEKRYSAWTAGSRRCVCHE